MFRRYAIWLLTFWVVALFISVPISVSAAAVGKFIYVKGRVDVLRGGRLPAIRVKVNDRVNAKDVVRTKSRSKARISFFDGNTIMLAGRTRIDIDKYVTDPGKDKRIIKLTRGKLRSVISFFKKSFFKIRKVSARMQRSRYEVHTPTATIGVRGTDFWVFHNKNVTGTLVNKGNVFIRSNDFPDLVINVPEKHYTTVRARTLPKKSRRATDAMIEKIESEITTEKAEGKAEQGAEGAAEPEVDSAPGPEADGAVSVEEIMVETEDVLAPTEEVLVHETIETTRIVMESGSGTSTDSNVTPPITETEPKTLKTNVTVRVDFQ